MMKKRFLTVVIFGLLLLGLGWWAIKTNPGRTGADLSRPDTVSAEPKLFNPLAGAMVSSPLIVRGQAPGSWFFEGSLPVRLESEDGMLLAQVPGQAEGEWMTTGPVSFSATMVFTLPAGVEQGFLVVAKDNPSGLPENAGEIRLPVRFVSL